jgi:hypothetical protein
VDRFGRQKREVRVITYYGTDNPLIDLTDPWRMNWFAAASVDAPDLSHRTEMRVFAQNLAGQGALAGNGAAILTPVFFSAELAEPPSPALPPGPEGGPPLLVRLSRSAPRHAQDQGLPRLDPGRHCERVRSLANEKAGLVAKRHGSVRPLASSERLHGHSDTLLAKCAQ